MGGWPGEVHVNLVSQADSDNLRVARAFWAVARRDFPFRLAFQAALGKM